MLIDCLQVIKKKDLQEGTVLDKVFHYNQIPLH